MTTDTASDAFFQGQGIPVDPRAIEEELSRLWGPAAERVGGPELEQPNVTRVVLANLVVVGPVGGSAELNQALDVVSTRFPTRTIVLNRTTNPIRQVTAEVTAQCHLPAPGLPQVCSEQIILSAGPDAIGLLPGAVRPLLEADLPFVLWWADDPRNAEVLFRDLADECSRVVLDLPDPGAEAGALKLGLDPLINAYSRETSWFAISRWRELLAQGFDPPGDLDRLERISSVTIKVAVPSLSKQPPRLGAWLVAWLAGQLGWTPVGFMGRSETRSEAIFKGPSQNLIRTSIEIHLEPSLETCRLVGAKITTALEGGEGSIELVRPNLRADEVTVYMSMPDSCAIPRHIDAPELDGPKRVASSLESSRVDEPFRKALPHLLWLLEG